MRWIILYYMLTTIKDCRFSLFSNSFSLMEYYKGHRVVLPVNGHVLRTNHRLESGLSFQSHFTFVVGRMRAKRSNKSFSTSLLLLLLLLFISIPNGIQHILRETGNLYSHTSLLPAFFSRSRNVFLCKRSDFLPFDSRLAVLDSQAQQEFLPLFCWTLHKLTQNDDVPFQLNRER